MPWEQITHDLKHPITVSNTKLKSVTLKVPNGRGLVRLEKIGLSAGEEPSLEQVLELIEITGRDHPAGFCEELHPLDIKALGEKVGPLLEAVQEAVAPPSSQTSQSGT